jgi:hypothetical protein
MGGSGKEIRAGNACCWFSGADGNVRRMTFPLLTSAGKERGDGSLPAISWLTC